MRKLTGATRIASATLYVDDADQLATGDYWHMDEVLVAAAHLFIQQAKALCLRRYEKVGVS